MVWGSQVSQENERLLFKLSISFWVVQPGLKEAQGGSSGSPQLPGRREKLGVGGWLGSVPKEQEEMVGY